jgi:hypothetical protein
MLRFLLTLAALCAAGVAAAPAALGDVAFSRTELFVGPTANGITAGDFDGDGVTDLAVTVSTDGTVAVLRGTGQGDFEGPEEADFFAADAGASAVATGDVDDDGALDLAIVSWTADTVSILLGHGDGTFAAPVHRPTGDVPRAVALTRYGRRLREPRRPARRPIAGRARDRAAQPRHPA